MSIPAGPSELAVTECAWGLARYAAISQVGPMPNALLVSGCETVCLQSLVCARLAYMVIDRELHAECY